MNPLSTQERTHHVIKICKCNDTRSIICEIVAKSAASNMEFKYTKLEEEEEEECLDGIPLQKLRLLSGSSEEEDDDVEMQVRLAPGRCPA